MFKRILNQLYYSAMSLNDRNVERAVETMGPFHTLLDIGCWDGAKTLKLGKLARAKKLLGIEIVEAAAQEAEKKKIKVSHRLADQERWEFADNSIDCIVSNQLIEHLGDVDHFFSEAARVLKPGGYIITSTNNLASWHNIFALLFSWAPFDLTNTSKIATGIGNPLALHKNEKYLNGTSWAHKCVYTVRWLSDWGQLYGLETKRVYGSGYYPLPAVLGRIFKSHSAFITLAQIKKPQI